MLSDKSKQGFTLIEALIVILVIALLAGMLFPVFVRAREKARQTVCISNLKQIATAWLMYADDYDNQACISYYWVDNGWVNSWDFKIKEVRGSSGLSEPHDGLITDPKGQIRGIWRYGLLGAYAKSGGLYSCPSFHGGKWNRPYTGYAYNASYIGGDITFDGSVYIDPYTDRPHTIAFLGDIEHPSKTAVFADAGFGYPAAAHNYLRAPSDEYFQAGTVHYRHNGAATVAYADGHVEAVRERHTQYTDVPWLRYGQNEFVCAPETGGLSLDDSAYDLE